MEITPDDREHGYDDRQEEEAYEEHAAAADADPAPASEPEDAPPADE